MNLNTYIIKDYCKIPLCDSILQKSRLERPLEKITFYRSDKELVSNQLYIIESVDFCKRVRFFTNCSFLCRGKVDIPKEVFPIDVLCIDESQDLFDIFEEAERIFLLFSQLELKLLSFLNENAPMKILGNECLPFFENPIAMYTSSLRVLFFCEREKEKHLKIFNENDVNTYLPDEDIDQLKLNPDFRKTLETIEPNIFPAEMWGYRILYYNILIYGVYIARIMICETDRPIRDSDYSLLLLLADFLKQSMQKQKLVMNNHPKGFDTCIQQLIQRDIPDKEKINTILKEYNWNINDKFFVCMIKISSYDQEIHTVSTLCSRLEANFSESVAVLLSSYILFLTNLTRNKKDKKDIMSSLIYILREGLLKAGVSTCFNNFIYLSDYYEQGLAAIQLGEIYDETLWCYYYENYTLKHLINRAAASSSILSLCPEGLLRLLEYDRINNRSFTKTLKIFLENHMSIVETIKKLYLQRATFLYQWKRIQEITEIDFKDYQVRLQLQIVFEIMDQKHIDIENFKKE